jgi:hypothetical protein
MPGILVKTYSSEPEWSLDSPDPTGVEIRAEAPPIDMDPLGLIQEARSDWGIPLVVGAEVEASLPPMDLGLSQELVAEPADFAFWIGMDTPVFVPTTYVWILGDELFEALATEDLIAIELVF